MKKTISIVGAFDRYNYGDLLFPIVIEEYIKKYQEQILDEYHLDYFGLIESDLSRYGGKPTKSIRVLFSKKFDRDDVILIAGGDVLPASLASLDYSLDQPALIRLFKKIFKRVFGLKNFTSLLKKKYRVPYDSPFIINPAFLKGSLPRIIYNSIGGSLQGLPNDFKEDIVSRLLSCEYLSVRNSKTQLELNSSKAILAPDSAMLISEFFPINELEKRGISPKVNRVGTYSEFMVLQCRLASIKNGRSTVLARQVNIVAKQHGLTVVLLPIGFAAGHDDVQALMEIKKLLEVDSVLFTDLNIFEIMYLIARSRIFVGTSLHGNITAMSYSVPHIGLDRSISKLDSYLATWDVGPQSRGYNFESLEMIFAAVLNLDEKQLELRRQFLIQKSYQNFQHIFKQIKDK